MKNLKNKLKNNKKGFTLVEIIVVLVILAVLAAAAIPTMLGFVEDSKGKAEIANARAAYIACQSIATEMEAAGGGATTTFASTQYTIGKTSGSSVQGKLDQMLGTDLAGAKVTVKLNDPNKAKVDSIEYTSVPKSKVAYKVTITSGSSSAVEKISIP